MLTREFIADREKMKDYSVAVIGLGISNIPVIRFLSRYGANITACDRKEITQLGESKVAELKSLGVELSCGSDYLDVLYNRKFDLIVRSPGLRPDLPQLIHAVNNGAMLTSEIELLFGLCQAPIVGVTGSDGKTTTTSLIASMLNSSGFQVHLGGNIGTPLIEEVLSYQDDEIVVLELSSFQLMTMKKSPAYSLITNISPNHLDYHKSYQEYVDAKCNIYKWQEDNGVLVLNEDNEETAALSKTRDNIITYSRLNKVANGACLVNGALVLINGAKIDKICDPQELKLIGSHNIENVLAAAAVARAAGAKIESIREVATTFTGVEHRLEFVRNHGGILYYNDSSCSSPTRTIAALNSFNTGIVLIAGGSDKYVPFDELGIKIAEKAKALVLLGQTSDKIYQSTKAALDAASKDMTIVKTGSLQEAVVKASALADVGDVVLLSPACASFDMFNNFAERGLMFKNYVFSL